MKKILKILILIAILILLFNTNAQVYALSGIVEEGQDFIQEGYRGQNEENIAKLNVTTLQNLSGYLYNILLALGVVVAVIVATILGIQFMIGGAEGQAKVKEMLLPFVVGCVVVFGGFGFWKIAITIGERLEGTSTTVQDSDTTVETKCVHDSAYAIINNGSSVYCGRCHTQLSNPWEDNRCSKCGKSVCPSCNALLYETGATQAQCVHDSAYAIINNGSSVYCGRCHTQLSNPWEDNKCSKCGKSVCPNCKALLYE